MTQTDMPDKSTRKPNRIAVRFDDEAQAGRGDEGSPEVKKEGGPTPEEVGRESAYEDATEVKRRVGRGREQDTEAGRERADEDDAAGAPPRSSFPSLPTKRTGMRFGFRLSLSAMFVCDIPSRPFPL